MAQAFIDQSVGVCLDGVSFCLTPCLCGMELSVCSVSTGEKGKKQVMKEEIDENNERQKEKETGLEIRAS